MYFNHQDKNINIIKRGKKENNKELSLTLGIKPSALSVECLSLCNQLQCGDRTGSSNSLRWNRMGGRGSGHWHEQVVLADVRTQGPRCWAGLLLGRVRDAAGCDAMVMGDAAGCDTMELGDAGRVREETEASVWGFAMRVWAERNQELEGHDRFNF